MTGRSGKRAGARGETFVPNSVLEKRSVVQDGGIELPRLRLGDLTRSFEFAEAGLNGFLLDLRPGRHDALRAELIEPRLERFIGVIYRPDTERWSHYSSASLPQQFDAWVWFDETSAVTALPGSRRDGADETYPFGL